MVLRVGLLWHSLTSGNLGVRALTLAHLELLERAAERAGVLVEVLIFGHPPFERLAPSRYDGRRVWVTAGLDLTWSQLLTAPLETVSAFSGCDMLIDVSEGDGFTDVYGTKRYLKQVLSKRLALRSGRPVLLAPQTIGPFSGRISRRLATGILAGATAVFSRDADSTACAAALIRPEEITEGIDLAFALPYESRPALEGARIGINPSGLLYRKSGSERFGLALNYPHLIDGLIEALSTTGSKIVLVPHVVGPPEAGDEDLTCCHALAASHPRIEIADPGDDPRTAKSLIASFDFFVGSRMHACIAAYSAGVPLLALAYTRKSTGLFRTLGYPAVADLTTTPDRDVCAMAAAAFAGRGTLRDAIATGNRTADRRLETYVDHLAHRLSACR